MNKRPTNWHRLQVCLLLIAVSCMGEARPVDSTRQATTQSPTKLTASDTSLLFSVTACHASAFVLCVQDTAIMSQDPDMTDPRAAPRWLLFGANGDSVEISASASSG